MKSIIKYTALLVLSAGFISGCSKFDEINEDPYLVTEDQVQVEYFINNAITGSQQDPHIAERIFVLYWKTAGRQQFGGGISSGGYNDGWTSDYYGSGYMGGWLNAINSGVQVAEKQIAAGTAKSYTNNLLQVSRIYRAYLMSELTDNFGPIPINAFQGTNPEFKSEKDVYYYMLDELKDASSKIDPSIAGPAAKFDLAYGFNFGKWQKYANSMRLRLAMRLSEVDAAKAKAEFEAAASQPLITSADETFQVAELDGWHSLTGVMTREWNAFLLSSTMRNLTMGLGGIESKDQVGDEMDAHVKPADYIGLRFTDHFTTMTNDPSAGYWLDGLPNKIDPRAYKAYIIPGDFGNTDFNAYPSWDNSARTTVRNLVDASGGVVKTLDAAGTWNAPVNGDWGTKGAKNQIRSYNGAIPRHGKKFRNSTNKRIFFAPWETYFLLAEAAVRGWTVPMSGQAAYEAGIDASFAYWDVSGFASAYKSSTEYNMAGTSVSWGHTAEPGATHTMNFINGYTNAAGAVEIEYPVNQLYKNGTVRNDQLTKIITQKFIAQTPYLPLETWSDHRRLGLPFFENPAVENPLVNMPALNSSNYKTVQVKFFPQRLKYPSSLQSSNQAGYDQAISLLGGEDGVLTPLWWAKKP
ncbi:SusD/RagB family nutrient-binding outer membrane lipoprotein [Flavihumibacter sp. CACIAM 22H1]|uniref:SusD/RagB family nutrient-binding outer membrane lipoprotein n=1 Tax=Flavihumibacter sp. CACIAM 22H1 TaxID=1812911 RepID=UPI0007A908E9|nr:SusD/RagB family nutrient-binding outer membrane lipoprotein [Flavihumibacter sp. CACIAM 22H1]KYP14455.1 MAG: susd and RagB outer membrane lipoprotein domain protein [Flavihumibacter sp. CACIAM 22H1]